MNENAAGSWIANARMYSVTPGVEQAWRSLLEHVARDAGVALTYVPYPAPQPLEDLWSRADLGAVFMCGYPIAMRMAPVVPLAAPIPRAAWAGGRAVYRSNLIVREDSSFRRLEDTFGGRAGWTVAHSHSGFNAFRHHLMRFRSAARPTLYRERVGNLVTARKVLDFVREGRIDVGPLDAYWHLLIERHAPQLCNDVRVLDVTDVVTTPAFVAGANAPLTLISRLREAFVGAARRPWFPSVADVLLLDGFSDVSEASYATTLEWAREATASRFDF